MRNVFLKAQNQRDFENKGYSTMPMLSSQEVNLVLSELQLMKPDDNFNPESSSEQPSYHLTDFDGNREYKIKAKQLISSILEPYLKTIFDNYKIITANFIIKPPGKGKFIVHQDGTFVLDTKNYTSLTIWCPLVDTNEENGTLQIVESSHKIVPDIATSTVDFYCKKIENAIVENYGKSICLKAGECLVFDHSLLHLSDDNHSNQPRYVMQAILVPSEIDTVFYYFDVNKPEKGFEVFQTKPDFFIFQYFLKRPSNLKSLGFIKNQNKLLTEEEFIEKMKKRLHSKYRELQTSEKLEFFEVDNKFYEQYIRGQKPEGCRSLGVFDYKTNPLTPEQLVEFMNAPEPKANKDTGIREKFLSLFNLLRGNDWWFYKIPPLLAIAYAEILIQDTPLQQSIITLMALLVSMFFVAAYGHVVNDIFDIEVDCQAGKHNRMAPLSRGQRILLSLSLAIAGAVPWLFIGFNSTSAVLLASIYTLLTIYPAPPLRLKERYIWGAVADAATVHAIPTLLVATVFSSLMATPQSESYSLAIIATAWAFGVGVRGILLHQIWDSQNDLKSGIKTLATKFGVASLRIWINYIVFPLEAIFSGGLVLLISQSAPLLLVPFTVYLLLLFFSTEYDEFDPSPSQEAYVGKNILLHDFYEVWLPLGLLALLSFRKPVFLILLALHTILFYSAIKQRLLVLTRSLGLKLEKIINLNASTQEKLETNTDKVPKNQAQNKNQTFVELLSSELEISIVKAIDFLRQNQLEDGELPTYEDSSDFDSSPFITSLILYSLSFLFHEDYENKGKTIIDKGVKFLVQEMELKGLWRYWSSKNDRHTMIPPDLDDICCISYILKMNNIPVPNNTDIILDNRNKEGIFYTWILPRSIRSITLNLMTFGKALSHSEKLWQLTEKNDICCVVNANVLLYLGETPQTQKSLEYLIDVVLAGNEEECSAFYSNKLSFYYMLSRAYFNGVTSLGVVKIPIVTKILNLQQTNGSFGDELLTALAICTLLNFNHVVPSLEKAIKFLLDTQQFDSSWQRIPMYGGKLDKHFFGSAALTTGFCVEALARYRLLDIPGYRQQEEVKIQEVQAQLRADSELKLQKIKQELTQSQSQLYATQTELSQSHSELQTSQAELTQLKSYLQQTQGEEGLINYYRSRIASNPDDIQLYHQALTIKPDDATIHFQLGNTLVRQNRFDDAIATYQTALQFHPDNFEIHLELGKALEKEKKWDEAIASYQRAIELNPDYSRSHQHLGDALAQLGKIHEASVCYRRALQLQPRIL